MPSLRRFEGELLIDNRFGPGVTAEFVRASGKEAPVVGEGALYESATVTCAHCGTVVVLNPNRTRPRAYCRKCDNYTCDPCSARDCKPFAKLIDELQEQAFKDDLFQTPASVVTTLAFP